MTLVCGWCGGTIDRPDYSRTPDPGTIYGLCPTCSEVLTSQDIGVSLQSHLDSIPIPILLIDSHNTVVAMNAKAGDTLGWASVLDQAFGRVFDCIYSRRPEGCTRSIHCSGCAIRKAIAITFDTGEPQIHVPATLSVENPDRLSEAVFAITTVRRDGVVLLRVEERPVP
ncbi:MAG TPA: PAS domain-containing protein [Candidatus Sulfotelmatobacter sp.]|nr:PAS domain-containing protein [Candidatus Sulfotelmatobacter sp.]